MSRLCSRGVQISTENFFFCLVVGRCDVLGLRLWNSMLMFSYLEFSLFCSSFVTEFNQPTVGHNDFYWIRLLVVLLTSGLLSDETFKYLIETIMATFLAEEMKPPPRCPSVNVTGFWHESVFSWICVQDECFQEVVNVNEVGGKEVGNWEWEKGRVNRKKDFVQLLFRTNLKAKETWQAPLFYERKDLSKSPPVSPTPFMHVVTDPLIRPTVCHLVS
jgi:hypothetical protein